MQVKAGGQLGCDQRRLLVGPGRSVYRDWRASGIVLDPFVR
jgi:hypothetical protein